MNRRRVCRIGPDCGDDVERVGCRLVNENRGMPRTDRLRYFREDRGRGVLESNRAAKDLADRIEEIDLLVTLRELECGVLDFLRSPQNLSDERQQHAKVIFTDGALRLTRCDGKPGSSHTGD